MKIVFNTSCPDAPASTFYRDAFSQNKNIVVGDLHNYHDSDIALFMSYKDDLESIKSVKIEHPHLKIGLIDPRGSHVDSYIQFIDFFVVDSIEMTDYFSKYQRPIFVFCEYPYFKSIFKEHISKKPVIIAYHGNSLHLSGMYPRITGAIELLAKKYQIEFWAMYNMTRLGKCSFGLPKHIPIRHIQWCYENYTNVLSHADIGIIPNLMPLRSSTKRASSICRSYFNDSQDDYLIRFKMPSNPGRIIVFSNLGIPVVADMYPSALQLIQHGINGFLAYSCGGWYTALEHLIISPQLRQTMAQKMGESVKRLFDYEVQNHNFLTFLSIIDHTSATNIRQIIQDKDYHVNEILEFRMCNYRHFLKMIASCLIKCIPRQILVLFKKYFYGSI